MCLPGNEGAALNVVLWPGKAWIQDHDRPGLGPVEDAGHHEAGRQRERERYLTSTYVQAGPPESAQSTSVRDEHREPERYLSTCRPLAVETPSHTTAATAAATAAAAAPRRRSWNLTPLIGPGWLLRVLPVSHSRTDWADGIQRADAASFALAPSEAATAHTAHCSRRARCCTARPPRSMAVQVQVLTHSASSPAQPASE